MAEREADQFPITQQELEDQVESLTENLCNFNFFVWPHDRSDPHSRSFSAPVLNRQPQSLLPLSNQPKVSQAALIPKPFLRRLDPQQCLFVANLCPTVDSSILKDMLEMFCNSRIPSGQLANCKVIKDKVGRKFAFIHTNTPEDCALLFDELQENYIPGLDSFKLRVEFAKVNRSIFISNFSKFLTREQLLRILEKYGPIEYMNLCLTIKNTSKGCAYVKFKFREDALDAIQDMRTEFGYYAELVPNEEIGETNSPRSNDIMNEVIIGNINQIEITEALLLEKISLYGRVLSMNMVNRYNFQDSEPALAYAVFFDPESAALCCSKTFLDRQLTVEYNVNNRNSTQKYPLYTPQDSRRQYVPLSIHNHLSTNINNTTNEIYGHSQQYQQHQQQYSHHSFTSQHRHQHRYQQPPQQFNHQQQHQGFITHQQQQQHYHGQFGGGYNPRGHQNQRRDYNQGNRSGFGFGGRGGGRATYQNRYQGGQKFASGSEKFVTGGSDQGLTPQMKSGLVMGADGTFYNPLFWGASTQPFFNTPVAASSHASTLHPNDFSTNTTCETETTTVKRVVEYSQKKVNSIEEVENNGIVKNKIGESICLEQSSEVTVGADGCGRRKLSLSWDKLSEN